MPQTSNRFFDDIARLATDAAGAAEGARREIETLVRGQIERLVAHLDLPTREEHEAVKEMAARARDENEALKRRVSELEAKQKPGG
jgi:BMFP domain-containing protein YqiC